MKKLLIKPISILLIVIYLSATACNRPLNESKQFDGERAFRDLEYQVDLGPRVLGSQVHQQVREWIIEKSEESGWIVELQSINVNGQDIYNLIARREVDQKLPWVIIGAHYDSRIYADRDPLFENRNQPVPGANDGASGVAVLLELARVIPEDLSANVWIVFFDAEDNGSLPGGEWAMGSRVFVASLEEKPDAVVIIDMVGDSDLQIFIEKNSDLDLSLEIWKIAAEMGYEHVFVAFPKHRLIDDHLPFIQAGIQAIDIIDFDYPYRHTVEDTNDKVSPGSLKIVGDVILTWLMERYWNSP